MRIASLIPSATEIVFALGLGLLALALNRILLVIFSHRAQRALAAEQQTAVGAGSSTDA